MNQIKKGQSRLNVPIIDRNDEEVYYEVLVEWQYNPSRGQNAFNYFVIEYPDYSDQMLRDSIDSGLECTPMQEIMGD